MAKISWGGGALLAPVPPALVTCGTLDAPAVLTVAWTGILNTRPPRTYISVRPERASFPIILLRSAASLPSIWRRRRWPAPWTCAAAPAAAPPTNLPAPG